ncbi:protein lin-28 homolog A [Cyanistes caeruleus]|uniref:protein lin-28 homolog A n=1 Tax=Cyanistes caeruleus TaxID=156563 RepID=UPI000CDB7C64|nr:protein lin-28 homolog A [Cyanistes caeruleus]
MSGHRAGNAAVLEVPALPGSAPAAATLGLAELQGEKESLSKLHMEGFRSLKEGEAVEFTFKKSSKGLESIRVTGPGGVFCIGSERRPKGKSLQKRRSKGDRCYNCGGLDHHAKECKLPPQPKKCHFCQSISHMVANCPAKAQQSPSSQGKPAYFREEEDMHSSALLPESRE